MEIKPSMDRGVLKSIMDHINGYLAERDKVREEAVKLTREIIRSSGWAVTSVHKGEFEEALKYLGEAEEKTKRLLELVRPYPELFYSGMVYNAVSEYVEARIFIDVIRGRPLRGPEQLGVQPIPYLQGLGDVVGELRRLALESLRREEFDIAWRLLEVMELLYLELRSLDYPDAIAPGVRRKADVARRLVDETKAMIVDIENRFKLVRELRSLKKS